MEPRQCDCDVFGEKVEAFGSGVGLPKKFAWLGGNAHHVRFLTGRAAMTGQTKACFSTVR